MENLSLNIAHELFIKEYEKGNQNVTKDIKSYNNHKLRHSIGVLEVGRNLMIKVRQKIKVDKNTIKRFEIICLLHDLGRFHQNDKNRILTNKEYEHGDESYKITKENKYDDLITLSIKYHNKFNIDNLFNEENLKKMSTKDKEETLFLTKLIRDADKLQNMIYSIFEVDTLVRINAGRKIGIDVHEEILKGLESRQTIDNKLVISVADEVVGKLCRVFDLNFDESVEILKFYGYIDSIIDIISKIDGVSQESLKRIKNIF